MHVTTSKPNTKQWLRRVIAPGYADTQRTYNDVATALFNTPSLSPRTEVYTHEDGRPELLLHLYGTIPVLFRGATYNIPLTIWLPHTYPRQPPMAFVTPAKDMLIRPGNHVDPSGRCYHPYLANWVNYSDKSNIVDLCDVLRGVFGREPPVYSKTVPPVVKPAEATPPPLPPLPEEFAGRAGGSATPTPANVGTPVGPPPLPPLPREMTGGCSTSSDAGGRFPGHQSPPPAPLPSALPVPPHPNAQQQQRPLPPRENTNGQGRGPPGGYFSGGPPPPSLPPASHRASGTPQLQTPPYNPPGSAYPPPSFRQTIPPSLPPPPPHPPIPHPHPHHHQRPPQTSPPPVQTYHHPPPQHYHPHPPFPPHTNAPPQPPPSVKRPDPIDIMSLLPPSPPPRNLTTTPPPLPPNPETALLLTKISTSLHTLAIASHTNLTSTTLPQAATQRDSLTRAQSHMSQELQDLSRLHALCAQDGEILRERIAAAEGVIHDAESREVPSVDAVVVGLTVVHAQLYELVTEDRAIEDTIYVLGKALDRERISLDVFLKHTRTLAREQFLLRALVKKIIGQIGIEE
ncbi:UEV domain-domain-containing protein [Tuber borchii]|uniref:UEV domain-domain-containing protein n=1 Tax=Tuber borchii TaxID=42251 RepID=A0A2T6ZG83_TUBBO|nr:UEV domain-domain-containing protein [Tuber borchii]